MASNFDIDLLRRVVTIIIFLFAMWYSLSYLVKKIQNGQLEIPDFLKSQIPNLNKTEIYSIQIIQRKYMPDATELIVIDIDGRHILLSRHNQAGLRYITDLEHRK